MVVKLEGAIVVAVVDPLFAAIVGGVGEGTIAVAVVNPGFAAVFLFVGRGDVVMKCKGHAKRQVFLSHFPDFAVNKLECFSFSFLRLARTFSSFGKTLTKNVAGVYILEAIIANFFLCQQIISPFFCC